MKQQFKDINFSAKSLSLITQCNKIIRDYQAQDLRLTLRQLYYRLVAANVIPNVDRSYKNLGSLLNDARLAGMVDWAAIEDRHRSLEIPSEWASVSDLVDAACRSFRLPRWEGQRSYVELWVEKDALAGVLEPLANEAHAPLQVNRGYSSVTFLYNAASRLRAKRREGHENLVIGYIGDHDPSGEDMVRDIRDRLALFGADVDVRKLALTTAQVEEYAPPENPVKLSDSRATGYRERFGDSSWEADALPPETLAEIVRAFFASVIDQEKMDEIIERENEGKEVLRKAAEGL